MRKPFKNTELSDRKCNLCKKRLKKNLLHKKPKADLCYKCFYPLEMARRGVSVSRERGASAVEYAIIVALIAGVVVGAVSLMGSSLKSLYDLAAILIP